MSLGKIETTTKSGKEKFTTNGKELDFDLNSFWVWSSSELLGNTMRGVLAEYIVYQDIGCDTQNREEWDAYDLLTPEGIKVEIKSSSYLQSWEQKEFSKIMFGIHPTLGWYASSNEYSTEKKRHADVYVFCVLEHKDKATVDPLNLDQWAFYILPTRVLNEKLPTQGTITLSSLLNLEPVPAKYGQIYDAIKQAVKG